MLIVCLCMYKYLATNIYKNMQNKIKKQKHSWQHSKGKRFASQAERSKRLCWWQFCILFLMNNCIFCFLDFYKRNIKSYRTFCNFFEVYRHFSLLAYLPIKKNLLNFGKGLILISTNLFAHITSFISLLAD